MTESKRKFRVGDYVSLTLDKDDKFIYSHLCGQVLEIVRMDGDIRSFHVRLDGVKDSDQEVYAFLDRELVLVCSAGDIVMASRVETPRAPRTL